jgi:hypothetical protein
MTPEAGESTGRGIADLTDHALAAASYWYTADFTAPPFSPPATYKRPAMTPLAAISSGCGIDVRAVHESVAGSYACISLRADPAPPPQT